MRRTRAFAWMSGLFAAGAAVATAQDPSDAIFNDNVVATYRLTMNQADWNVIVNDPTGQGRLWKPCAMSWQGAETLTQVAVRAGGHPPAGANPKPHIRLKFDEFVPNQKWRGMDALKLESMTKNLDRSMLRERLAFGVHRSLGPAARVCHARLYVNGDFKGLYSVIEPVRKAYVRYWWRQIPNPDGNLYEIDIYDPNDRVYNGGPPFDHYLWRGPTPATYVPYIWKPVTNEVGGNYQDVVNLLNVLNNASSSTRRSQLEGIINLNSLLSYVAGVVATSNFDALNEWMGMPNNHFWYHREDTNRMEIIPWDLDVTFSDITFSGTYMPSMSIWYQFHTTKATSWIQGDAVARDAYLAKLRQIVDGPFTTIQSRLDFIYNQIRSHAYADPYKPFTNAQFDAEVNSIRNSFIPKRIASLKSQLPAPPPPTGTNNAQFLSHTVPSSMAAGSTATVTIAMKNTGTATWTGANKYALGHSAGATPWTWRERRVWLSSTESVAPNATKTFSFTITAPSTAGSYAFPQWRMVQDGVAYFGTSSPALTVTVTGGGPTSVTKSFQNGVSPTTAYVGTRDTYVTKDAPTANFGTAASLTSDGDTNGTGNDARALLRWYVTDIPPGSTVQSARIVLHVTNPSSQSYEFYRVYRYWSETQATWTLAQTGTAWQVAGADGSTDRGQTVRGAVTAAAAGAVTISLNSVGVSMVQAWVNDPASNFGVILLDAANTDGLAFASKEAATVSQRPKLQVTYTPPPAVLAGEETAPADSVIDGGENPLTLEDALEEATESVTEAGGGGGGGGGGCGALGLDAALFLGLVAVFRRRRHD